jgi:hypothetical protein
MVTNPNFEELYFNKLLQKSKMAKLLKMFFVG